MDKKIDSRLVVIIVSLTLIIFWVILFSIIRSGNNVVSIEADCAPVSENLLRPITLQERFYLFIGFKIEKLCVVF